MSPKDKAVLVRLSDDEREQIEKAATEAGFATVSAYVRHMTIGDGKGIIVEMREEIRKILAILQEPKK